MLNKFSEMIRGNLTKIQRQKIVALVTIEVHARDVIEKMIKSGCGDVTAFEWLSQLRLYWDKVCVIGAVFIWVLKSNWFALLRYTIGLKSTRHFFIQSEVKPKPIVTGSYTLFRASRWLHVFRSRFDWFTGLSISFVIGKNDYFGFRCATRIEICSKIPHVLGVQYQLLTCGSSW